MQNYLLVFLGGGLGSMLRFSIGQMIAVWRPNFPWATILANVLSCFLLGMLVEMNLKGRLGGGLSVFFMAGFCGGFSTFSTFTNETMQMIAAGQWLKASLNVILSLITCLAALYSGMKV